MDFSPRKVLSEAPGMPLPFSSLLGTTRPGYL